MEGLLFLLRSGNFGRRQEEVHRESAYDMNMSVQARQSANRNPQSTIDARCEQLLALLRSFGS